MPHDPLDGIKTFKGRVVYDRKPHKFTPKDLRRIFKNSLPREIPEDSPEEKIWFDLLQEFLEEVIQYLLTGTQSIYAIGILVAIAKVIDSAISFCKGDDERSDYQTGGAGVSGSFGEE